MTDQRVLVHTYTQIFSINKTGFSPVKNTSHSPAHSPELIFHIMNMSQDASVSLSLLLLHRNRKKETDIETEKYYSCLLMKTLDQEK